MRLRLNTTIQTVSILLLTLCVFYTPVKAQEPGVTLTPISYDANHKGGDTVVTGFTVTSTLPQLAFELQAVELFKQTDGSLAINPDSDLSNIVSLSESAFTLATGEAKDIVLSLSLPGDITPGDYFLGVQIIFNADDTSADGNAASIDPSLIFRLNLNVIDTQPAESIKITKLTAPLLLILGGSNIEYTIHNELTQYAKPLGYLQIVDPYGKPIWKVIINDGLAILPGTESLSGSESAPANLFKVAGRYTVEFLVLDQQLGTTDIKKLDFVVIPPLVIWGGLSVLLVLWLIKKFVKPAKHRKPGSK